jgi:hypothetical protein
MNPTIHPLSHAWRRDGRPASWNDALLQAGPDKAAAAGQAGLLKRRMPGPGPGRIGGAGSVAGPVWVSKI